MKAPRQSVAETRRHNLRILTERLGLEEFCRFSGKSRQQLHQYIGLKPTRSVGDKFAREIEAKFHLPEYWLDDPQMASALSDLIEASEILQGVKFDTIMRRLDRLERLLIDKLLELERPRLENNNGGGNGNGGGSEAGGGGGSPVVRRLSAPRRKAGEALLTQGDETDGKSAGNEQKRREQ